ncbi:MAG: 16S rRNA (guanine(527)-N(7))-methyltransferase RsmG [Deltaproteobacteria bacterium]|nr:16S rRNA (guanine(527)-N(7))-methyltransferase RsmG [Deltaproteobacteria bacterium]
MVTTVPRETLPKNRLLGALLRYQPELPESVCAIFLQHFELLCHWNKTHNLTRLIDPDSAALLHYVDSLLPLKQLEQPLSVVDIGSGTGLPGIAALAWWPEARVFLVDSSAKKVSFLRSVRARLSNRNLEVVHGRCQEIPALGADLVLIRATFKWPEIPAMASRHLATKGSVLAYLGQSAPSITDWMAATAKENLVAARIQQYFLPGKKQVRHAATALKE